MRRICFVAARWTMACVLLLTSSGCAARQLDAGQLPSEEFAGYLVDSGDGNWFEPCGDEAGPRWWVTFVDEAVRQVELARDAGRFAAGERHFVRVVAARTDERHVGPGGPALLVRNILELRPPRPDDCRP
jgi:hypothetical protein